MSKWTIESKVGVVLGVYEGDTKRDAFMAMLEDSYSAADYGAEHVGTEADYHITPYEGTLWIDDSGRGAEQVKDGMGKQEHAAARIQRQYGVRCEWAPANREYVVDFRRAGSTAAQARRFAREYARRLREEVRS